MYHPPTRLFPLVFAIALTLMALLLACEGETITIEQTEDGAVVRTSGGEDPGAPRIPATPGPTATLRPGPLF